jgi:hypothetical protein
VVARHHENATSRDGESREQHAPKQKKLVENRWITQARLVYAAAQMSRVIINAVATRRISEGKDIHLCRDFSHFRILWKSRKGFESRFAVRAMPEMANDPVIQEFGLMGSNDLVAAPNALDPKHEHRASLLHRA